MRAFRRFVRRVVASAGRRRDDERVREELAEHQALLTDQSTRAGMQPDEARRRARQTLGSPDAIVEAFAINNDCAGWRISPTDVRYAIRSLTQTPGSPHWLSSRSPSVSG